LDIDININFNWLFNKVKNSSQLNTLSITFKMASKGLIIQLIMG